jgi:hypothetical protein
MASELIELIAQHKVRYHILQPAQQRVETLSFKLFGICATSSDGLTRLLKTMPHFVFIAKMRFFSEFIPGI